MITLKERTENRLQAKRRALDQALRELEGYAREHGGKFILFGSAAKGNMHVDSDVDLIADFGSPNESRRAASATEAILGKHELRADVRPNQWCSEEFLQEVALEAKEIRG